jgi:hypothetical protein
VTAPVDEYADYQSHFWSGLSQEEEELFSFQSHGHSLILSTLPLNSMQNANNLLSEQFEFFLDVFFKKHDVKKNEPNNGFHFFRAGDRAEKSRPGPLRASASDGLPCIRCIPSKISRNTAKLFEAKKEGRRQCVRRVQ